MPPSNDVAYKFMLYDAVSDTVIDADLADGVQGLTAADLAGPLAVVAFASSVEGVVRMTLTGPGVSETNFEGSSGYSVFGDQNDTNFFGAELAPGDYTATATPLATGVTESVDFNLATGSGAASGGDSLFTFQLIDADSDQVIDADLADGVQDLAADDLAGELAIVAISDATFQNAVRVSLSGPGVNLTNFEGSSPYSVAGDIGDVDFAGLELAEGSYSATATGDGVTESVEFTIPGGNGGPADGDSSGGNSAAAAGFGDVVVISSPLGEATPARTIPGGVDIVNGTNADEFIGGTDDRDALFGFGGDDFLNANDAADFLFGGDGDDRLQGRDGDDLLAGESGNDTILGGPDADSMFGGSGNDNIFANAGPDEVFGGAGEDVIAGEGGDDRLAGNGGNDKIYSGGGNDVADGGAGDDFIGGGNGNDVIFGGAGKDEILAGGGNDVIEGGPGDNIRYYGGRGNDMLYSLSWGGEPVPALDPAEQVEKDEPIPDDDFLEGATGSDTYVFRWLIDAKPEIVEQFTDASGDIDYKAIAKEANGEVHDHWIETIGDDFIRSFRPNQDRLVLEGHTVAIDFEESGYINDPRSGNDVVDDTYLVFTSVNRVRPTLGLGPGAHEGDNVGTLTIFNQRLDIQALHDSIDTRVFYGVEEPHDPNNPAEGKAIDPLLDDFF